MRRGQDIARHAARSRWDTIDPATGEPLSPEDAARARVMFNSGQIVPRDHRTAPLPTLEDQARKAALDTTKALAQRIGR